MSNDASADPLRILIAADTYPPDMNGAARFCERLAQGMLERGHEVHVVAARTSAGPSYESIENGIVVHRLRSHRAFTHPYYRLCFPWEIGGEVTQLLREVRPDVVHVQCHYMIGKAFADTSAKLGIRLIATNHFMPENLDPFLPFPQWFKDIVAKNSWRDMGKVMGQAQIVTTPTPLAAKAMHDHAFLQQVLPVSNGIDAAKYERADDDVEPAEQPTILFVGRLAQEKHVDVLIEALSLLPDELDARLEIVGDGEVRPALDAKVAECGVGDRVTFLGLASDEELRKAYLRSTVFCQPGTAELQSLVTLEAMSASKPVVLANAMALPHLVDPQGRNGSLFRPNDARHLAEKLRAILELPEGEREQMGRCSREMVNKHDLAATLDTFESLYRGTDLSHLTV